MTEYFDGDMLVILTDIDGYYDKNPHEHDDAVLQKNVTYIEECALEAKHSSNSEFATGGIVTKLKAADFLMKNKKNMFLASGFNLTSAYEFLLNKNHTKGTLFVGKE